MKHLIAVEKEFLEKMANFHNPTLKYRLVDSELEKEEAEIRVELAKYLTGDKQKEISNG